MASYLFLASTQVKRLHAMFIANAQPTQPPLLDPAVSSRLNSKRYNNQENLFQLVAILADKIIKNHAFSDGNKRIGLLAANMFLKMNGYQLHPQIPLTPDRIEALVDEHVNVATGGWPAVELAKYYERIVPPMERVSEKLQDGHKFSAFNYKGSHLSFRLSSTGFSAR